MSLLSNKSINTSVYADNSINQIKNTSTSSINPDDNLLELVDVLNSIKPTNDMAKLNTSSITDNNGHRIIF